jgi:hypothetical protein
VLGEQGEVERLLGVEVAVEHGLGHVRRGRDLVEPGGRVTALGEEPCRRVLGQRATLVGRKPLAKSPAGETVWENRYVIWGRMSWGSSASTRFTRTRRRALRSTSTWPGRMRSRLNWAL